MQAVFADQSRGIASALQGAAERVIMIKSVVEVGVTNEGVSLVNPGQEGATSGSADWGARVVLVKDHAFTGHAVEVGRVEFFISRHRVLPQDPDVAVA